MKAYPRIWCMNAYPIVQLSYVQCPGDIIISDFGKNEKNLISCNKISSVQLYLNNWCYNDWCIIYKVDVSKDFGVHGLWNYINLYTFDTDTKIKNASMIVFK